MTLAELVRMRATDPADADRAYLRFDDRRWTFAETHREACRYANLFRSLLDPAKPPHVGLLLENRPEFVFAELGAALAGAVIVGLNPTRRGTHLARDVAYADCQVVVTEARFEALLADALAAPDGPRRASSSPRRASSQRWRRNLRLIPRSPSATTIPVSSSSPPERRPGRRACSGATASSRSWASARPT
jgi:acyl-CoA synthetase (AMP-forming)/AMP-acid ligase II